MSPAISVIIPFYNRVLWVTEALESVLGQSEHDLEAILVDDGSTETFRVPPDPRVHLLSQPNLGPASARNLGLAHARGHFVAFLDSDDLYLPRKLETQRRFMEANPDIALSHTSYVRITETGSRLDTVRSGNFAGLVYPGIILNCPIATPTVMVRRVALEGMRFPVDHRAGEDVMLWVRLARRGRIGGIPEALSAVRVHGGNAADDPDVFLQASHAILNDAATRDPSLGTRFLEDALTRIYLSVGALHAKRRQRSRAFHWFLKAWKQQPRNSLVYRRAVAELLLPPSILSRLGRL